MTPPAREIVLDIETTGLLDTDGHGSAHRIIEIACLALQPEPQKQGPTLWSIPNSKESPHCFYRLINPQRPIPPESSNVHGLTDKDVANQPLFHDIAPEFISFIEGARLIAHNGSKFDFPFLDQELKRARQPLLAPETLEDTILIAKTIDRNQQTPINTRYSLDALLDRYEINRSERQQKGHSAMLDARLLAKLYLKLTKRAEKNAREQIQFNFSSLTTPRAPTPNLNPNTTPKTITPQHTTTPHRSSTNSSAVNPDSVNSSSANSSLANSSSANSSLANSHSATNSTTANSHSAKDTIANSPPARAKINDSTPQNQSPTTKNNATNHARLIASSEDIQRHQDLLAEINPTPNL